MPRYRSRSVQPQLSASTLRAIALARGVELEGEPADEGRYEVTLLDEETGTSQSFCTNAFSGPGRVDLEDACAFGGFDTVIVRRRRGRFSATEAPRRLREIVEDLTYDHAGQFYLLAADDEFLGLKLHTDFDDLPTRSFRRRLLEVLALCGFAPKVERDSRSWLELTVGPKSARRPLLVPKGRTISHLPRRKRSASAGNLLVLLRAGDPQPETDPGTTAFLPVHALLSELHSARIATLQLQMSR